MRNVIVYSKYGKLLDPCNEKVAGVLLQRKRAIKVGDDAIKLIVDKNDLRRIKRKVIKRDNRVCFYCGKKIPLDETATVDHLIPKTIDSNGKCGFDSEKNLVCCCYNCNHHKGDMNFEDYIIYRHCILIAYLKTRYIK